MNRSAKGLFAGMMLIVLLFFGEESLRGADAPEDTVAQFHFRKGDACVLLGDTLKAIQAFEKAVQYNRKYSMAHHRLAQLYLGLGTLEDRIRARHHINKAVLFDRENVTYLHTQLKLYLRIRFYWTATRIAKKLIAIDPTDARAYFTLGLLSEREWFRYDDMIDIKRHDSSQDVLFPQDGVFTVDFSRFAKKDLDKALDYYQRAVDVNPRFCDGYYRLAFICNEMGLLDRMVNLLREALRVEPDKKDYHLFLGLAYHQKKKFNEAWNEYAQAKSLMQPDELALFESVDLISPLEGADAYRHASADEKERKQYQFWKQKDPLFLTEVNERRLEHYGRMAYVNLRFSSIWEGIEGWKTAQGQVYIRYGAPFGHYKTWPFITAQMGGGNPVRSSEGVWHYPGFTLVFEDVNMDGVYTFYNSYDYKKIVEKEPERYNLFQPEDRFKVSCTLACFRDKENRSVLEIYHSIPQEVESASEGRSNLFLKRGVFIFDQEWNEIQRDVNDNPYFSSFENTLSVSWNRMQIPPGDYHLVVEYLDEEKEKLGRWLKALSVESFHDHKLGMSDVVLAWDIGLYQTEGELRRGGLRILPNTLEIYQIPSFIPIYFEIYNLTYSSGGKTNYRLTFTVQYEEKKRGVGRFIKRIWRGRPQSGKVVTSYEYQGDRGSESIYQNLTLEGVLPRNYRIAIEVEDMNSGEKVAREKMVTLIEDQ